MSHRVHFRILVVALTAVVLARNEEKNDCSWLSEDRRGSFLWRIERTGSQQPDAYLLGTVHGPYRSIWPYVPRNAKRALRRTDAVFTELDLTDSRTVQALAKCRRLQGGQESLKNRSRPLHGRVQKYLTSVKRRLRRHRASFVLQIRHAYRKARHLYDVVVADWQLKRTIWILLILNEISDMIASYETEVEALLSNPTSSPLSEKKQVAVLDLYLTMQASRQGKLTGAVEKVRDQCNPLNNINSSLVLEALDETLKQLEVSPVTIKDGNGASINDDTRQKIIDHYNCGALDTSIIINNASMFAATPVATDRNALQTLDAYFRNTLLFGRNKRMATRIASLLRRNTRRGYVFAIGAGHLVGLSTVQDELKRKGYVITSISRSTTLKRRKFSLSLNRKSHWRQSGIDQSEIQRQKAIKWRLSHFGELWRRLDLSFGPESFFQRQSLSTTPSPYLITSSSKTITESHNTAFILLLSIFSYIFTFC